MDVQSAPRSQMLPHLLLLLLAARACQAATLEYALGQLTCRANTSVSGLSGDEGGPQTATLDVSVSSTAKAAVPVPWQLVLRNPAYAELLEAAELDVMAPVQDGWAGRRAAWPRVRGAPPRPPRMQGHPAPSQRARPGPAGQQQQRRQLQARAGAGQRHGRGSPLPGAAQRPALQPGGPGLGAPAASQHRAAAVRAGARSGALPTLHASPPVRGLQPIT